jgi:KaiC/GvpD/RAD55 family RecA-like ATPase/5S rRNA maturation endonuclease (ribonuclease M5)
MASFIGNAPCPKCQDKGADKKGNNRILYDDGGYYCFNCGDYKNGTGSSLSRITEYTTLPMYTTESILSSRGISAQAIKDYGLTTVVGEDGQMYVKFPLHDVNKAETSHQLRAVDSTDGSLSRDIKFSKGKIKLPLFGWRLVKPNTKTIVICEGLTDTLYFASHFSRSDVVVIGLSTATAAKKAAAHLIAYDKDYKIILAFDTDVAGENAVKEFVSYYEAHDEEKVIYRLQIPDGHKDIGDWRPTKEQLENAVDSASPLALNGLVGAKEIAALVGEYFSEMGSLERAELNFSSSLSNALRLTAGKFIAIIGAGGEGKSTLAEHFIMEYLQQKKKVFVVSQEMMPSEVAVKLLRMVRNEPLDDPKFIRTLDDKERQLRTAQVEKLVDLVNMTNGFGEMSLDCINNHIHKLTSVGRHPSLVVIDHLFAISEDSEPKTIIEMCKRLKDMARNHKTCIVILSHTSKPPKHQKSSYQPQVNDAYGSSGIAWFADAAIGVVSRKSECVTLVEMVKVDRLGGKYVNLTFDYSDYVLTEKANGDKATYIEGEGDDYEEAEVY